MDYAALKQDRLQSTKIAPYDMITAVTQRAINTQLQKIHAANKTLQSLVMLSGDPDDDYSRLDAELAAPTVELCYGTDNRRVIFSLNIKKAALKYLRISGRKATEQIVDIPPCVLAVSVNLTFEGIDFKSLPAEVQTRLKGKHNYSINQLIIDFSSASIAGFDPKRSTVHEHITDPTAASTFDRFIIMYFTSMTKKNGYILNYIPLAPDATRQSNPMPSVPPTDFTIQNIPFVLSAADNGRPSEDNMLVFLQMTRGREMPTQLLPISANWVVPPAPMEQPYDGTVALSKEIFHDGWLLPNLAEINRTATWISKEAACTHGHGSNDFKLSGSLGREGASMEDIKWTPILSRDAEIGIKYTAGYTPGQFYTYQYTHIVEDREGVSAVWQMGITNNWLFIPENYNASGKCEILMSGFTYAHYSIELPNAPHSKGVVQGHWNTSITLDGVCDGELIITAPDIVPTITHKIEKSWEGHASFIYESFVKPAEEGLNKLDMKKILGEIRDVLTNSWDFVLPGSGDFYINRAIFNKEKDLLCELKYKN